MRDRFVTIRVVVQPVRDGAILIGLALAAWVLRRPPWPIRSLR